MELFYTLKLNQSLRVWRQSPLFSVNQGDEVASRTTMKGAAERCGSE
jgi:hypothetical protein